MSRILPGIIMTALWVLLIAFGPESLFWLAITILSCVGLYEYFKMTIGTSSGSRLFLIILVAVIPTALSLYQRPEWVMAGLFVSLFGTILLSLKYYSRFDNALYFLGLTCFGVLYIAFCLGHLVFIRYLPQGASWLIVLTVITAGADTGAYYIGRNFGKRKLCSQISPGKTVEGALGGIMVGSVSAMLAGLFLLPEFRPSVIFAAALFLSAVSISGDLAESIVKRSVDVKDSGSLLFGHGGLLDRIDSLLIAAPVLYYLLDLGLL